MRRGSKLIVLLSVFACYRAGAQAQIGLNFTGVTSTIENGMGLNLAPPDTTASVGPDHVVEFINGAFAIYNKSTGTNISTIADWNFWANAGAGVTIGGLSDTRLIYDPTSSRWFASQVMTTSTPNSILLARSDSSDPTGGWKSVRVNLTRGFGDFPMLGVDADGVYLSTNTYASISGGSLSGVSFFSIPKADLLQTAPSLARMTAFETLSEVTRGFTVQPVSYFGPSKGHGSLIAVDATQLGKIDRTNINGSAGAGATLSPTTVITAQDEAPPKFAYQPDGTRTLASGGASEGDGDNYNSTVYQVGNQIWAVHGTIVNDRTAIRWTVVDERTNAIIKEGTIANASFDYIYPSIAANAFGEAVIGFTRTGNAAGAFPSAFASVGTTTGGTTIFSDPILLKAGLASYHKFGGTPERWGDYSTTVVDPSDPHVFWTTQEFAAARDVWGTQITQITVPEPGVGLLVLGAALMVRRVKR